jgi:hypothetical protein
MLPSASASDGSPAFNSSNLVNRENIERALHPSPAGATLVQINSVAELLCNTGASEKDLLYANSALRASILVNSGLVQILTLTGKDDLSKVNPAFLPTLSSPDNIGKNAGTARFKLTPEGKELVEKAKTLPYLDGSALDRRAFEATSISQIRKANEGVTDALDSGDPLKVERAERERDFIEENSQRWTERLGDISRKFSEGNES